MLFFVFASIYQYNRLVKLNYTLQKIEKEKVRLGKLFDQQRARLCALKDARTVKQTAATQLGFAPVKLSQLISLRLDAVPSLPDVASCEVRVPRASEVGTLSSLTPTLTVVAIDTTLSFTAKNV